MKIIIGLLTLILWGCAGTPGSADYDRITSISLASLNSEIYKSIPVSLNEIISSAKILKENELSIEINLQKARVISRNNNNYLAVAFEISENSIKELNLTSYIISVNRKSDYLFFPSFTAFDKNKLDLGRISAVDDYSINEGRLTTSFIIPINTRYLLLHTEPEYLQLESIDGKNGGLQPFSSYTNQNLSVGIAAVLGGVIGGAIAGALSANAGYNSSPPENYFFGPGGVVDIEIKK